MFYVQNETNGLTKDYYLKIKPIKTEGRNKITQITHNLVSERGIVKHVSPKRPF